MENVQLFAAGNANATGNSSHNTMTGNLHANTMHGMEGNDHIDGYLGNDALFGGVGNDTVNGNHGNDTFRYGHQLDSTPSTFDVIQDFQSGFDRIDLSALDANSLVAGNQAFAFNAVKPFFYSAGDLWLVESNGNTSVYMDINGDNVADMRIDVLGVTGMPVADFTL